MPNNKKPANPWADPKVPVHMSTGPIRNLNGLATEWHVVQEGDRPKPPKPELTPIERLERELASLPKRIAEAAKDGDVDLVFKMRERQAAIAQELLSIREAMLPPLQEKIRELEPQLAQVEAERAEVDARVLELNAELAKLREQKPGLNDLSIQLQSQANAYRGEIDDARQEIIRILQAISRQDAQGPR